MLRLPTGVLLALAAFVLPACKSGEPTVSTDATGLALVRQPSADASSGVAFAQQPAVQLIDDNGKAVKTANVMVDVVIGSGGGTLSGTHPVSTDTTGLATFTDLRVTGLAGVRTLEFNAPMMQPATSKPVLLAAGPPRAVAVFAPPQVVVLSPFSVTVAVTDAYGNPVTVTNAPASVSLSLVTGTGTLSGNTTMSIPVGASAITVSGVEYSKAESGVVLRASLTGTGSSVAGLSGTTPALTVTPAGSSQLTVATISTQTVGVPFSAKVTLADASGQPTTNSGASGTISIGVRTGTGTLGGVTTTTIPVGASTATFSGLTYSKAETGVSLSVKGSGAGSSVDGLAGASNTFTVADTVTVVGSSTCGSSGTPTLSSLSRDLGSAAGGDTVTLLGSGFTAVPAKCVTFGTDTALAIANISSTKLRVTVPPHATGTVSVSLRQNGTTSTLTNAFEYLPAPTTTWTSVDFENGSFGTLTPDYTTNATVSVDNTVAHAGARSAKFDVPSGGGSNTYAIVQLLDNYNGLTNLMLSSPTGVYHRWYERITQASLDNVQVGTDALSPQIKIHLDRVNNTDTPPPWLVLGIGDAFGSTATGELVVQNDMRTELLLRTGYMVPGDTWVEYVVWYRRTGGLGYAKLWINGKLKFSGNDPQLGSDTAGAAYTWQLGIPFTQNNGRAIRLWVDDVVVANGYVSP